MDRRKRHKVLAVGLAVALTLAAIGNTVAVQQEAGETVMTGHSSWMSASTSFNSCFAGIAGLLLQKVTWFNGQTLFQRSSDGGGNTWVYFTEHFVDNDGDGFDDETGIEVADPANEDLFKTDNTYTFDVPGEDKTWVVKEYFALRQEQVGVSGGQGQEPDVDGPTTKVYVFAVKVADRTYKLDDVEIASKYNFVGVVDTCRFHSDPSNADQSHPNGREDDTGYPIDQHDADNEDGENHTHDEYTIDLWVGGPPDAVPGTEEIGGVPDDRDNSSGDPDEDAKNGKP